MQYNYEIYIEGQSFKDLGLDQFITSLSVTHQTPKSRAHRSVSKNKNREHRGHHKKSPHEAVIKFLNPRQSLSGYFHELDEIKIWLGTQQEMFFQGNFLIDKLTYSASSSENHSLEVSLVCKTLLAVKNM